MPGIDGIELTRHLQCAYPGLSVVLITASNDERSKSASTALGVTLLSKPFDDVTLFAAIAASRVKSF
jgi:CheY-like chemotaxis protein